MNGYTANRHSTGRLLTAGMLTTGLVSSLLAATMATSSATPTHSDGESNGPGQGGAGHVVQVVCFNIPRDWNAALDGPLPQCHRTVR